MKNIAVIGAGISGLAAAYLLSRRHRVHLFEKEGRVGGHTQTVLIEAPTGTVPLDTGFLVHNDRTYPNLVRLFAELSVATRDSDMRSIARAEPNCSPSLGTMQVGVCRW